MFSLLTFSLKWNKFIQEYAGRERLHLPGRSEMMFTFFVPLHRKNRM